MFVLQDAPINPTKLHNQYRNPQRGGFVCFEGIVRNDKHPGREVTALLYIAENDVCIKEGEAILKEAVAEFSVDAVCVQRTGQVKAGETAIWIGVWSAHRDAAFKGCRYIIEEVKKRLLVWKKEIFTDGTSAWVRGMDTPTA